MLSSILQKIPFVIIGAMFIVAAVLIYVRSKNVTRSESLKILRSVKLFTAWVLLFTVIITATFAIFNHIKSKQSVMAIIAMNYSEASLAQNSNGTRYNMTEITCDEVIERAIELGAFEDVTVKELKDCLYVYPYVQGDVDDKTKYHISTEFIVEYHASKHTQHLDAENVIVLVASAYKEYYIEKYTDNFNITARGEKPDYSTMEYMDIVAYLNKETSEVLNYLYGMSDKASSFVTSNNSTFLSIASKVHQFKEMQIEQNLKALIVQYGIVKYKQDYIDRLMYQNTDTQFEKQKNVAAFNICSEAIDMYAEEMTRVVLVPTWDQNGEYYMGRTKVGIDELSVLATDLSNRIAQTEQELMSNRLVIEKIQLVTGASALTPQADELIATIDQKLEDFTVEAVNAGREYADYKMNQCIAVSISGNSLFSELKAIVIFAFLAYVCAIAYETSRKFPKIKR